MRNQTGMEYMLILGAVIVVGLLTANSLVSSSQNIYYSLNTTVGENTNSFSLNYPYTPPTPPPDTTPPSVSLTVNPSSGDTSTTFDINCTASDNVSLSSITLYDNGSTLKTCSSSPCTYSGTFSEGDHTIECNATDNAGNSNSDSETITVSSGGSGDTTPPTITSFTANPSTINEGDSTTLECNATDNVSLSSIKIYKNQGDSSPAKTCNVSGTSASCSTTVTYSSSGTHTAKCVAADSSGNAKSDTTTIQVNSPQSPPPPSCTDECNPSNYPTCSSDQYCTCSDTDGDGCYELSCNSVECCSDSDCPADDWSPTSDGYEYRDYYCSSNYTCQYSVTNSCTNECTQGDIQCIYCNYQSYQVRERECVTDADSDPCTEWEDVSGCLYVCPV